MSTIKRSFANFSFYDNKTIEKILENMAEQGWMIEKAGNLYWTYRKIQPQNLRFAVTYFPGASEFDPRPSEKQLDKEYFCARDGWRLVLRWDAMQIFCTDRDDAVPIDTDPVPYVENVSRTMNKKILTGQLVVIIMILWSLYLQISQMMHDPAGYLSDTGRIYFIPLWLLLLISELYQVSAILLWQAKAKKAAENGSFLPVRPKAWISWAIVIAAAFFLIASFSNRSGQLTLMICLMLMFVIIVILGRRLMARLRKKGVSRRTNIVFSSLFITVLVIIGMTGILFAVIGGHLNVDDRKEAVGTYEINGHIFDIYDDPLPLEAEGLPGVTDIAGADVQWSKEADEQESFLLSYGRYRQDQLTNDDQDTYSLEYEITDVKVSALYDFVKGKIIGSRHDVISGDTVFADHYEPIDPSPWNAEEAYQLHWSDSVLDTYVICYKNRIVEITFYWTPDAEQIEKAAQALCG